MWPCSDAASVTPPAVADLNMNLTLRPALRDLGPSQAVEVMRDVVLMKVASVAVVCRPSTGRMSLVMVHELARFLV